MKNANRKIPDGIWTSTLSLWALTTAPQLSPKLESIFSYLDKTSLSESVLTMFSSVGGLVEFALFSDITVKKMLPLLELFLAQMYSVVFP